MAERYQREIEEILEKAGDARPKGSRSHGPKRSSLALIGSVLGSALGGKKLSLSPGRLMLIAVVLLLTALVLQASSAGFVAPLLLVGFILFIVAYGMFFVKPWPTSAKRWRGRVVEYEESWLQRVRRRLRLR